MKSISNLCRQDPQISIQGDHIKLITRLQFSSLRMNTPKAVNYS